MIFASDNWAGVHPDIAAGLSKHAAGFHAAYGNGELDGRAKALFNEVFEKEVAVFFVATGTAANALALSSVNVVGGVSFCHREAHLVEDECGASEFLTGGARLCPVDGPKGRIDPAALENAIDRFPAEFLHAGRPMAVSITQATEIGTVYGLDELDAISAICRRRGLPLHMDGARFANALVSLGTTPAEITWKRGVDLLSFGATKNGCWCAEAVVLFDPAKAGEFAFIHKRAAQLFSKSRFVAAQFEAYFANDLWLRSARHANAMAQRLAGAIKSPHSRLAWEPQANEVFLVLENSVRERIDREGVAYYDWHPPSFLAGKLEPGETICRFVTSFATEEAHVDRLASLICAQ